MLSRDAWLVRDCSSRRGLSGAAGACSTARTVGAMGNSKDTASNRARVVPLKRWDSRRNTSSISQASSAVRRFRYRLKPAAT
ncbi:hypothetical protein D3C84_734010 [compost metagenome]